MEIIEMMLRFPKPLIAAVDGAAVAGGGGLVLACDLVVAAHGAKFGFPEPKRGIVAGIVAPLLSFRTRGSDAALMLLTGRIVDAPYAHRAGFVHVLVESEQIWAKALELAKECAQGAPAYARRECKCEQRQRAHPNMQSNRQQPVTGPMCVE